MFLPLYNVFRLVFFLGFRVKAMCVLLILKLSCISLYFRIWSSMSPGCFNRYTMHWCGKETIPSGRVRKQWRTPFKDRRVKTRWWYILINRNYRENTGKGKISVVSPGYTITISVAIVVIISLLDLQLPVQSVPTTTKVVSMNPARYNIIK